MLDRHLDGSSSYQAQGEDKIRWHAIRYAFGDCVCIYMCLVCDAGDHRVAKAKVCVAREPCRAMSRIVFLIAGTRVPNVLAKC